jgi:hypothetical protein
LIATITLEYDNAKIASAVAKAVCPDNQEVPKGMTVITQQISNKVAAEIQVQSKMATLIATIDDLLESAGTAEKILHVAKNQSCSL